LSGPLPVADPVPDRGKAAESLFLSVRTNVACRVILKCGCTFLKNLLWHLDHDAPHPRGNWVHRDDDLPRTTGASAQQIRDNPLAFIVLRDPVERFLSLYFDKVMRPRAVGYKSLREELLAEGLIDPEAQDIDTHRRNAMATIGWIGDNLAHKTGRDANRHWTRQSGIVRQVAPLQLRVLTLNGLNDQLRVLLSPAIPDIDRHLAGAKWRNRTPRDVPRNVLADDALRKAILRVYRNDALLWSAADALWQDPEGGSMTPDRIPRLGRDILV
jgi:hypothetical protein